MKRQRSSSSLTKQPYKQPYKKKKIELKTKPGLNEWKWFDETLTQTGNAYNGVVVDSIVKIPQGTDVSSRIGNKITVKSVSVRAHAYLDNQSTQLSNGLLRIIVFIDKQSAGYTATVGDVLAATYMEAHFNMNNRDRFVILKDKVIDIPLQCTASTPATEATYKHYQIYVPINVDVDYSSTNASIPTTNNIGVLFIANGSWVNAAIGYTRVRYSDD